ncbi:MAG: LolA family protein [Planctomycetota bacterium]
MRTRTLILIAAGALFALICILAAALWPRSGEPVSGPVDSTAGRAQEQVPLEELTAAQILDRVASTYASCESYRDTGVVKTVFIESDEARHTTEKSFKTAFVRPDRFRFEYTKTSYGQQQRYIIWADGNEVLRWSDIRPGVERPESLGLALVAATGVSGGSAHTIPRLLLPEQVRGRRLTDLPAAERVENRQIDGATCLRVKGSVLGQPTTVWIDRETFAVRRIDGQKALPGFRTEETTTYEPVLNEPVPSEMLEFNPPDAGDGSRRR